MARDEALMTLVGTRQSPPTLRLYQWDPPTISLGYFQRYAEYESLPRPAGGLAVVRRLTGGGAILHDLELTYSIALPIDHPWLSKGPNRLYEMAHDVVIAALANMGVSGSRCGASDGSGAARGPFFCFERRHGFDVLVNADKIAGSAQRRTRTAVLQHGSIILGNRFPQQPTATVLPPNPNLNGKRGARALDPPPTLRARFVESVDRVRRLIVEEWAKMTGVTFEVGTWSDAEFDAASILRVKYAGQEWTRRT